MSDIANDHIYPPGADQQDWVQIEHDDIEGQPTVTREAFDQVWQAKDWRLVAELGTSSAAPVPVVGPTDVNAHTKDELIAFADAHGIDSTGTKQEIYDRLVAANLSPAAGG